MEKRIKELDGIDSIQRCRRVLQKGLMANPNCSKICQVDPQFTASKQTTRASTVSDPRPGHDSL